MSCRGPHCNGGWGRLQIPSPSGRREFIALEPPAAGVLRTAKSERLARVHAGGPKAQNSPLQALLGPAQRRRTSRDRDRRTGRLFPACRTTCPDRREPVVPYLLQTAHAAGGKRKMPGRVPQRDASRWGSRSGDSVPGRGVLCNHRSTLKPDVPKTWARPPTPIPVHASVDTSCPSPEERVCAGTHTAYGVSNDTRDARPLVSPCYGVVRDRLVVTPAPHGGRRFQAPIRTREFFRKMASKRVDTQGIIFYILQNVKYVWSSDLWVMRLYSNMKWFVSVSTDPTGLVDVIDQPRDDDASIGSGRFMWYAAPSMCGNSLGWSFPEGHAIPLAPCFPAVGTVTFCRRDRQCDYRPSQDE